MTAVSTAKIADAATIADEVLASIVACRPSRAVASTRPQSRATKGFEVGIWERG